MSSVDKRIVEMQFDNKQFENNIQTSIKSLDNLKKGLNLEESAKSLSNLDKAGKSFSLAGIAEGVETVASKFSALGVMGITVLQNLANAAVNAGKKIVKSLAIDPILEGYGDYGRKLTSVQTITNATGKSIKEVSSYFNQLDTYADKTIYNLSDMTSALAKFTNAGVDLDKSVPAIKGIANMVALAGQDANAAQIAMYNLSQSISSGFLTTLDYKSLNLANVATKEWKNQMIEGAIAAGTLKKNAKGMYSIKGGEKAYNDAQLFTEALSGGWATTDVLLNVLGKYGDETTKIGAKAQSAAQDVKSFGMMMETLKASVGTGWTDTFEILVGNLEESKALFTPLTNTIGGFLNSIGDARNALLQVWKDNGGRDALIEALTNTFKGLFSILKPIKEAFKDIFPPMTGKKLAELTKNFRDLTEKFKIGNETANNIKRTFKGLFAILDIGKRAFTAIVKVLTSIIKYILPAGDGLLSFTGSIGDFFVAIDDAIKSSDIFNVAIEKIGKVLKPIANGIKSTITTISKAFKFFKDVDMSGVDAFSERVTKRFEPFTKLGEITSKTFSKISEGVKKVAPTFYKLAEIIREVFGTLQEKIVNSLDNAEFKGIFDIVNGGLFAAILLGITKFIKSLTNLSDNAGGFLGEFKGMFGGIKGVLDGVKESLKAYQSQLKAGTLLKIAIAIGILAAALAVLSLIDSKKLTSSLAAMSVMFVELFGSMAVFEKIMGSKGFASMGRITLAMIALSIAILILSIAMTKLAKLDWGGIAKGLTAIAALSGILIASAKLLEKNTGSLIKASIGFIIFAGAINVLAIAVEKLGVLDTKVLAKGLIGIGVLMTELVLFMKTANLDKMGITKGLGILFLATAINILANVVEKFSSINPGSLVKGLAGVAVILTEVAIFVNTTGDAKKVISTAIGLTILGTAMLIFTKVVETLGKMPLEEVRQGLTAMALALTTVIVAMKLMPKNIILTGIGLITIATALVILSKALQTMGGMTWEEIARGLVTLAVSLTIITVAMSFMTSAIPGAAALLIVSAALAILAPVLQKMGSMSLAEIGKSLLVLVGVFTVLGVAALVLAPLVPVILALAAAIALLGIAALAVGAGMLAFAAGLSLLAISGAAGAAALVLVVTAILGMIPMIIKTLGIAIIDLCEVIITSAPAITAAITVVLLSVINAIVTIVPKAVAAFLFLLTSLLESLAEYMPKIVRAGMDIIIGFLEGIAEKIDDVVEAAIDVILSFIDGIAEKIPDIIDSGFNLILSFINGLSDSIEKNTPLIIEAIKNLVDTIIDSAIMFLKGGKGKKNNKNAFKEAGKDLIKGFINGIKENIKAVGDAASEIGKKALSSIKSVLGIESPSKEFLKVGMYADKGFAGGLKKFSGLVDVEAKNVGSKAINSLKKSISYISEAVNNNLDASPTIRPVLDLTDIQNGNKKLSLMFNKNQKISVETANKRIQSITSSTHTDTANTESESTKIQSVPGASYSFTQNNYSPKALSRLDIYRQTKNQFSILKGAVGG